MQDPGEIARPYALAAFQQALEEDELSQWSDMLAVLTLVVRDPTMSGLIVNPRVEKAQLVELILDVAGNRLSRTGQNLVRVLGEYDRLAVLPQVERVFNEQRSRHERRSAVRVMSAFELSEDQEKNIAEAMRERLGTEVSLSVEIDQSLIGGVVIRAGDLVIDASLRGRLNQLRQSLS